MPSRHGLTAEMVANHFVGMICQQFPSNQHVRRVASWLGFIAEAIDLNSTDFWYQYKRQLCFESGGQRYKLRYAHPHILPPRGGFHVVRLDNEVIVHSIGSLDEARDFFDNWPTFTVRVPRAAVSAQPAASAHASP